MKRSRMICCGGKSGTDDGGNIDKRRPPCLQPPSSLNNNHHLHHTAVSSHHPQLDENRGAHNKYDARPRSLTSSAHHHHHHHHGGGGSGQESARSVDMSDLTITLPGMVSGAAAGSTSSNNHHTSSSSSHHHHHHSGPPHSHRGTTSTLSSEYSIHSHPAELKSISKREKARQKLTNSLKRAKVLLSDRGAVSSADGGSSSARGGGSSNHNTATNALINSSNIVSGLNSGGVVPSAGFRPVQGLTAERFKVIKLKAAIDKKPTSVDERSTAVLKYRTPHFRAVAHVEVPCLRENQGVQIGWIQACTEMRFINSYGPAGATSWEFPEIVSGKYKMIGDADGKQYPWYGSKLELQSVYGPSCQQTVTVHMNDNFFPQVTWYVPHPDFDKTPRLSHIHRKQKFFTFLVAKDLQTQEYIILNTIEWSMELNIEVDSSQPLGKRARLTGPFEQPQPVILTENSVALESYALAPPNANNAQTLIWRPSGSEPKMIVPPVESTMEMDRYLLATRNFSFVLPMFDANGVQLV